MADDDPIGRKMRRILIDDQTTHVIGTDPRRAAGSDSQQAQLAQIGETCRQWFDSGYEPATLISGLLTMACYFADNMGIEREELHRVIREAHLAMDRQLIHRPLGRS